MLIRVQLVRCSDTDVILCVIHGKVVNQADRHTQFDCDAIPQHCVPVYQSCMSLNHARLLYYAKFNHSFPGLFSANYNLRGL